MAAVVAAADGVKVGGRVERRRRRRTRRPASRTFRARTRPPVHARPTTTAATSPPIRGRAHPDTHNHARGQGRVPGSRPDMMRSPLSQLSVDATELRARGRLAGTLVGHPMRPVASSPGPMEPQRARPPACTRCGHPLWSHTSSTGATWPQHARPPACTQCGHPLRPPASSPRATWPRHARPPACTRCGHPLRPRMSSSGPTGLQRARPPAYTRCGPPMRPHTSSLGATGLQRARPPTYTRCGHPMRPHTSSLGATGLQRARLPAYTPCGHPCGRVCRPRVPPGSSAHDREHALCMALLRASPYCAFSASIMPKSTVGGDLDSRHSDVVDDAVAVRARGSRHLRVVSDQLLWDGSWRPHFSVTAHKRVRSEL